MRWFSVTVVKLNKIATESCRAPYLHRTCFSGDAPLSVLRLRWKRWMWLGLGLGLQIKVRNCSRMLWYIMEWWMGRRLNREEEELVEEIEFAFEICALEDLLEAICSFIDSRTTELETPVYLALDELTFKILYWYMGLGVSPSQIIGSSSRATSSTTSFESNERIEQMQAEIDSLKAQVAETPDLESPVNRRSSEGSHMPEGRRLLRRLRSSSQFSHRDGYCDGCPDCRHFHIATVTATVALTVTIFTSRRLLRRFQGNRRSNRRYVKIATGCATVGLTVAKSARDAQLCDGFPTVAILALRQL
ncbi:hypothetical protein Fmac_021601 [Flemingia macrophylla]|uniref:Uncharacterized protein n=1 Tax=Flemingia macrophylla TaxID=520843 RepID=A0ABD1LXC4_9FABA